MFRHVLLLKWRSDATDEQKRQAFEAVATLPQHLDVIRRWQVAENSATPSDEFSNHDLAIIADFDTVEAYLEYRHHPYHLHVIDSFTKPILQELARVQFTVDATQA